MIDPNVVRRHAFIILDKLEELLKGRPKTVPIINWQPEAEADLYTWLVTLTGLNRRDVMLAVAVLDQNHKVVARYGPQQRLHGLCLPPDEALLEAMLHPAFGQTRPNPGAQDRGRKGGWGSLAPASNGGAGKGAPAGVGNGAGAPELAAQAPTDSVGEAAPDDVTESAAGNGYVGRVRFPKPPARRVEAVVQRSRSGHKTPTPMAETIRQLHWFIEILVANSTDGAGHLYLGAIVERDIAPVVGISRANTLRTILRGMETPDGVRVLQLPPEVSNHYYYLVIDPGTITPQMVLDARRGPNRFAGRDGLAQENSV